MTALLRDYFRRSWLLGLPACAAAFAFQMLACRVFLQIHPTGSGPSPFANVMPKWVQSAFNIGPTSMTELNGFLSVCYQHPFLLTVLLAMPIALLTAWLSGDVEKRSIALVLSRPVGRIQIVVSVAIVTLLWCALGITCAYAGCLTGAEWTGLAADLNRAGLQRATLNLAALVFAFTGIAAVVSTIISVRGDAVGWCLTIVLVMYVWNFLAQIWYGGGGMTNYSLFRFYQPTKILLRDQVATSDAITLAVVGLAGWVLATGLFRFRSFSV